MKWNWAFKWMRDFDVFRDKIGWICATSHNLLHLCRSTGNSASRLGFWNIDHFDYKFVGFNSYCVDSEANIDAKMVARPRILITFELKFSSLPALLISLSLEIPREPTNKSTSPAPHKIAHAIAKGIGNSNKNGNAIAATRFISLGARRTIASFVSVLVSSKGIQETLANRNFLFSLI